MRDGSSIESVPPSGERAVVAVPTYRNLSGIRQLVPGLVEQTKAMNLELVIVDNGSTDGTREWLAAVEGPITVLREPINMGPAGAYNRVFTWRPTAPAYLFFGDDTIPSGGEVAGLLASLRSDDRLGIVAGTACTPDGHVLTTRYRRRPFENVFPRVWSRWWGEHRGESSGPLEYVDVVSGSGMAIRGELVRDIGRFETLYWPVAFEDLDYCARTVFRGWKVAVDHTIPIRQEVSATTTKIFGADYGAVRRSTGLMYVAMNYPLLFAAGRFVEGGTNVLFASQDDVRRGDAQGLLRCAREWRRLLRGRKNRRRLRRRRRIGLS